MLGYTREELLGKHIVDLLEPASKRPELREYLSLLVKERPEPTTYFQQNRRKDGKVIDQVVSWNYSQDGEGNVVGFISVITDITERKQAEESLQREASMRSLLLENLPCIAMIQKQGTREIVYSNGAARKVGAVPGTTCYGTCAQRDDPCPFCLAPEVWTTNTPRYLEVEYRDEYFEDRWLPLTDDLYVHYIFNITEIRRWEGFHAKNCLDPNNSR